MIDPNLLRNNLAEVA
ncbi:Serine--tRNA ligase, partial [Haemophilus influenzae]